MTNARAQWDQNPVIEETHWFGQYEYVDIAPGFVKREIHWSGNYIESTEIWRGSTGGGTLAHQPKTSYYSWLEHELRFSVDDTNAWKIRGTTNTLYNPKGFPDQDTDGETNADWGMKGGGQGLKNMSGNNQNFYIHNLKAGDSYDVRYYVDGESTDHHITGSATGTATVTIPANALIRNVVITLAEYVTSDFKVEEVDDVSSITGSYASYSNTQLSSYGTLGYKYSFEGPGVLEDKRGAAPYITMRFGNDNDMTFVRKVSSATETVTYNYGDWETITPEVYSKDRGESDPSAPSVGTSQNGDYYYVINDPTKDDDTSNSDAWETQLWVGNSNLNLQEGDQVQLTFYCQTDNHNVTVGTQTHTNPGTYKYWYGIGDVAINTGWWQRPTENLTITVRPEMVGGNFIAFNLNPDNQYNEYRFAAFELKVRRAEKVINVSGEDVLAAASIINEHNELNPTDGHLQYPWTYKNNGNYSDPFNEDEIKDRFVGKEWSTFTAEEDPNHGVNPNEGSDWTTGEEYVYGDRFNSIWPLCGNFFYFFPEVDGLLQIEYYCEGTNEIAAFWYKQKEGGEYAGYGDQPNTQFLPAGRSETNGSNNYTLTVPVKKGGIYYLCSLPTNLHAQPIVRLKSYTFIPNFRVAPLYKVIHNSDLVSSGTGTDIVYNGTAIQKVAYITGGPYTNLSGQTSEYGENTYFLTGDFTRNEMPEPRVKCLGNVVDAKAKVESNGTDQWISFYDIKFRQDTNDKGEYYNPGGAVVAHVENSVGQASFVLTIAYDAVDAKWNNAKDTRVAADVAEGEKKVEVKHWDFYSGKGDYNASGQRSDSWDLGQYKDNTGVTYTEDAEKWKQSSKLYRETHKADGLTADWEEDYVDVPNSKERIFKSIYDMEGDNADMVHETAGLVFFTHPNEFGIYNENGAPTSAFQDRFIGLMGGGKLIIPRLKADDRVVIKMGCFGNVDGVGESEMEQKAILTLTNAKDAKGDLISGDYEIGGSIPYGEETSPANTLPHGEYHFIVNETSESDDTDFAIEVKKADLLKIYSIDIYKHDETILSENQVKAESDKPYILNVPEVKEKDHAYLHLRYRGQLEPTKYHQEVRKTGNLTEEDIVPDTDGTDDEWFNYVVNKDKFGIFKTRLGVQTYDKAYVTDYAESMIPVGYREVMEYPYTWDFTDLKKYVSASVDTNGTEVDVDEEGYDNSADLKIWNEYSLRTNSEEYDGYIFAPGSQLYGGTTMFAETRGIGIFHNNTDNKVMAMTSEVKEEVDTKENGGLAVSDEYGFVVPQVAKGQAVYVHATPVAGAPAPTYAIGNGEKQELTNIGTNAFAMKMGDNASTDNVTLYFKGYEVNKIAVSGYAKSVNKLGYASESRADEIDPELMAYMTGTGLKAYIVSEVIYDNEPGQFPTVKLTAVNKDPDTNKKYVIGAATHHDHNAYIIYNTDNPVNGTKAVNALNGGFHLFVPDMHDKSTADNAQKTVLPVSGNGLRAWLPAYDPEKSDYDVMNQTYTYTTKDDGSIDADGGDEGVKEYTTYVLSSKGKNIYTGVTETDKERFRRVAAGTHAGTNKAYLPLLTEKVKPSNGSQAKGMFAIVFVDEEEGTETTSLNGVESTERTYDDGYYYTLGGMKVQNPTKKGIYIKNGKKIIIK